MALVKFGQQSFEIADVPDGHVIISQSELTRLKESNNVYLTLKSQIPIGIDTNQLAQLVDKGQRYDAVTQENNALKTEKSTLQSKVDSFSNIPQSFTIEKWNKYEQAEKQQVRDGKRKAITQSIYDEQKLQFGVSSNIDDRFIPSDALNNFDFDAPDAKQKWESVLEAAEKEQSQFLQNQGIRPGNGPQPGGQPPVNPMTRGIPTDTVGADGIHITRFE